jgi:hypothetical protein
MKERDSTAHLPDVSHHFLLLGSDGIHVVSSSNHLSKTERRLSEVGGDYRSREQLQVSNLLGVKRKT